jgi:hypothetical protein
MKNFRLPKISEIDMVINNDREFFERMARHGEYLVQDDNGKIFKKPFTIETKYREYEKGLKYFVIAVKDTEEGLIIAKCSVKEYADKELKDYFENIVKIGDEYMSKDEFIYTLSASCKDLDLEKLNLINDIIKS